MQILQWLFTSTHDHTTRSNKLDQPCSTTSTQPEPEADSKALALYNRHPKTSLEESEGDDDGEVEIEPTKGIKVLLRREDSRSLFYSLLDLKQPKSQHMWRTKCSEMGGMGHNREAINAGCKVLPLCDAVSNLSISSVQSRDSFNKDRPPEGGKRRAVSRMKELVRWAAAAKVNRGAKGWKVLYFRSRVTAKDRLDDASLSSNRRSFNWDVGSCSASSSVYSPMSLPSTSKKDQVLVKHLSCSESTSCTTLRSEDCIRTAHWITTDSNFLVLEL